MYIFNVTNKVSYEIEKQWIDWVKSVLIQEILQTQLFQTADIFHLDGHDDEEGATYIIQYTCKSNEDYQNFLANHETALMQKAYQKFGTRFIAFKTFMKKI